MTQTAWAQDVGRTLLADALPRRWAHTQGVAARARSLAPVLDGDANLLEAAAWLHDVGYAPRIAVTGFHPLDGARYLRDTEGAGELICRLVANHTCAHIEAEERGLAVEMGREFPPARRELTEALIYCDMTTSPDGLRVNVADRLDEIQLRYGPSHVVSRFIDRARPQLVGAAEAVEARLRRQLPE